MIGEVITRWVAADRRAAVCGGGGDGTRLTQHGKVEGGECGWRNAHPWGEHAVACSGVATVQIRQTWGARVTGGTWSAPSKSIGPQVYDVTDRASRYASGQSIRVGQQQQQ